MGINGNYDFSIKDIPDLGAKILSYYSGIGYSLVDKGSDIWVFHRGDKFSFLYRFDIRAFPTILTVKAAHHSLDDIIISSNWAVTTTMGIPTKGDYERLEGEARDFAQFLNIITLSDSAYTGSKEPFSDRNYVVGKITERYSKKANWLDWIILIAGFVIYFILTPRTGSFDFVNFVFYSFSLFGVGVVFGAVYYLIIRKLLANLFPHIFKEYICSNCQVVVPNGISSCPNCKTNFIFTPQ